MCCILYAAIFMKKEKSFVSCYFYGIVEMEDFTELLCEKTPLIQTSSDALWYTVLCLLKVYDRS